MNSLLLATLLFTAGPIAPQDGAEKSPGDKPSLEGTWTVVCFEKDGQPVEDCKNSQVTIKNNRITFEPKEGKEGKGPKTLRLQFAQQGKLRVTEIQDSTSDGDPADAKEGVYVLTQDYLAVCVHSEKSATSADAAGTVAIEPNAKSRCTVILQRSSR